MKYLAYSLSIAIILFVSACGKEKLQSKTNLKEVPGTNPKQNTSLTGKWKVVGNMVSSGGPMYFIPASGKDHVDFNTDKSIDGSAFPDFKFYTLTDSVTIKITKEDTAIYQNYRYTINGDSLSMSAAGPTFCIEGCVIKLVKE